MGGYSPYGGFGGYGGYGGYNGYGSGVDRMQPRVVPSYQPQQQPAPPTFYPTQPNPQPLGGPYANTPTTTGAVRAPTAAEAAYAQSQGYNLGSMVDAFNRNPTGAWGAMTAHGGTYLQDYLNRVMDPSVVAQNVNNYGQGAPTGDWSFALNQGQNPMQNGGYYGNAWWK